MSRDLEALRAAASIVAIIGNYVKLRREGHEHIGLCPFHEEKTPSFKVDPKKNGGVYICFGCGAKGDVFRFVQMVEDLEFKDAVKRVRELSGKPETPTPAAVPGKRTMAAPASAGPPLGPIVATYTYLDEKGATLFEVCRHEPGEDGKTKTFRQRVPIPGGYSYSVKDVRRVLYRLPALLPATEVWICEGEKDVHALEQLGLVATTNAGGAKSPWLAEYTAALKGKDIVIVPDNDDPGRARGEIIAKALAGSAERVTTIILPNTCKDVTDYIEAGNSAHDLRIMVEEARSKVKPASDPSYAPLEAGEQLTPNDIARLIIRDHAIVADKMGYIFEYNHRFWERITRAQILAYAMAYDVHQHTKARRRNESAEYVLTYGLKRSIPWRAVRPDEVPIWNGVMNLETSELRPHRREDYLETITPVPYMGEKPCSAWLEALRMYWGEDEDYEAKVSALQEFFGYCLMTHARYKKALVLFGESDSGKSQPLHVLRMLVGPDNTCAVPVEHMDDPRKLSPIVGKMINILSELKNGKDRSIAEGGFKTLVSSEEALQVDPKWGHPFMYAPLCKHVFACNVLPQVTDTSRAVFNRLLVLRFNRIIPRADQDRNIIDEFRRELEGILAWSLAGARRLYEAGGEFTRVPESERLIEDYRNEQNPINAFLAECCDEVNADLANPVLLSVFAEKFSNWAGRNYDIRVVGGFLKSAGVRVEKVTERGLFRLKRCVFGLEIKNA